MSDANLEPHRLNRMRVELHVALLVTLSATLLFVATTHPSLKALGALFAACGAAKAAACWELRGLRLPFALGSIVACLMAQNLFIAVSAMFRHQLAEPWPMVLGVLLGLLFVLSFRTRRIQGGQS